MTSYEKNVHTSSVPEKSPQKFGKRHFLGFIIVDLGSKISIQRCVFN